MKRLALLLLVAVLLPLAACAAPAAQPQAAATAGSGLPAKLDRSCRSDADCAVKDVGNCCGAQPACVNVDSPTDPAGVMAQCRASGRMSVCGFREISGCSCVAGQCAANPARADTLPGSSASPTPVR